MSCPHAPGSMTCIACRHEQQAIASMNGEVDMSSTSGTQSFLQDLVTSLQTELKGLRDENKRLALKLLEAEASEKSMAQELRALKRAHNRLLKQQAVK